LSEVWKFLGLSRKDWALLRKKWKLFAGCFILAWIVATLFSVVAFYTTGEIVPPWVIDESLSNTVAIPSILFAVSLSPIIQEFSFRWPILITKKLPKSRLWLLMALLLTLEFVIIHKLSIRFSLYCLLWSIIVIFLALRLKSVLPAIIFHALWNGAVIILFLAT
jgi:hypothetical protein